MKVGEDDEKPYKLFHDDTLKTFCRRLSFSPDGLVLFTPCGLLELNEPSPPVAVDENKEPAAPVLSKKENKKMNATYAFTRNQHFAKPVVYYPSADRYSVAVRCCPVLFELRSGQPSLYDIPYRMVFAVATQNALLLYDTQQSTPFARIARIHYTRLTDLTWYFQLIFCYRMINANINCLSFFFLGQVMVALLLYHQQTVTAPL